MTLRQISSRDNPQYKLLRQLASSSQARRKQAKTLLDGVHLCQAWLQHRGQPELCVVGESASSHPEVSSILKQCAALAAECVVFPDALFAALSQVEQGSICSIDSRYFQVGIWAADSFGGFLQSRSKRLPGTM